MKTYHLLPALLLTLLTTATTSHAQDKDAIKRVQSVYEKIESAYKDWGNVSLHSEGFAGPGSEEKIWRSEDEKPLLRVEVQVFDDHGPVVKQFYLQGDELLFVLRRDEMTPMLPNAATTVTEKRYYFSKGKLVRALQKQGKFAEGKAVKMDGIENKTLPLSEVEDAAVIPGEYLAEANGIVKRLTRAVSDE